MSTFMVGCTLCQLLLVHNLDIHYEQDPKLSQVVKIFKIIKSLNYYI